MTEIIRSERLDLIPLCPAFLKAMLARDLTTAERILGFTLPDGLLDSTDAMELRLDGKKCVHDRGIGSDPGCDRVSLLGSSDRGPRVHCDCVLTRCRAQPPRLGDSCYLNVRRDGDRDPAGRWHCVRCARVWARRRRVTVIPR